MYSIPLRSSLARFQVLSGAILQQVFVVEYTVGHQFCTDCHRTEASDTWNAVVQLRQKVRPGKDVV